MVDVAVTKLERVVVVGGSLAGLRACETLRNDGYAGVITLVSAEDELPYDRPPLSKKLLAGDWEADRIRLRKAEDFASLELDLRLGTAATSLDTDARRIGLFHDRAGTVDTVVTYDALIIATGATPRQLSNQPDLDHRRLSPLPGSHPARARLGGAV